MVENSKCSQLILRIASERIHFLKFILEGYDGLALLSTVDAKSGMVAIKYPPMVQGELLALLDSLSPALSPLSPPSTAT